MYRSELANRFPSRTTLWILGAATAAAFTLSAPPFLRHVYYFARVDARAPAALVVALLVVAAASLVYTRIRRSGLLRWEPAAFAAITAGVCLWREPLASLVAAAVFLAAFSLGDLALRRLRFDIRPRLVSCALAVAVGAAVLAFLLFLLGLAGGFQRWAFALVLGSCCTANARCLGEPFHAFRELQTAWRRAAGIEHASVGVAVFYSFQFLLFGLAVVLAPAINNDAMRDHLADVERFLAVGGLVSLPTEQLTFFPKSMEVLLAAAYSLGGPTAAEMLNPGFFLCTLLLGYAVVRRCGVAPGAAVLGTLIAAAVPFFHWTGVVVKNDFLLALFQMAALYCWLRSRDDGRTHWLVLSAFLVGASFGVKHTAVFGAIPFAALFLWSAWKRPKLLGAMAVLALSAGFYWHARTWAIAGSPLHPLGAERASEPVSRFNGYERPPAWTLHISYPWKIHFDGRSAFESPTDNPAGMFLVFGVAAWLLVRRRRPQGAELACLAFCAVYYVYWGWIWGLVRYALVPLLLIAALTAARWRFLYGSAPPVARAVLTGALAYCFAFATPPTMMIEINAPQLRYLAGGLDRNGYLREAVAGYPGMRALAEVWQEGDLALNIGSFAVAHSPDPLRMHSTTLRGSWNRRPAQALAARYDYDWLVLRNQDVNAARKQGLLDGMTICYRDDAFAIAGREARMGRPPTAPSTSSPSRSETVPLTSTCRTPTGDCAGSE